MICVLLNKNCMLSHSVMSDFATPMDGSLPDSSVNASFQAKTLEWVTISSYRGFSQLRDRTQFFCISWIGKWILYHWLTRETQRRVHIRSAVLKKMLTTNKELSSSTSLSSCNIQHPLRAYGFRWDFPSWKSWEQRALQLCRPKAAIHRIEAKNS